MSQSVEQKKAEVLQFDPGEPKSIPFEYFDNRSRRSTNLIDNDDESNFMRARNQAYWFEPKNPIFLNQIDVETDGYGSGKELEFRWITQRSSKERSKRDDTEDGTSIAVINDVVTAFCIKPPSQHFSKPRLKRIRVWGLTLDELDKVMGEFGNLDRTKAELREQCEAWVEKANEAESRVEDIEAREAELTESIEQFTSDETAAKELAAEAQTALQGLEKTLVAKRSEESDMKSRLEAIEDNIDQKKKEAESLNSQITEKKRELKSLKDDVNLFPTEISGYVEQGAKNIRHYSKLALVPVILLVLYTIVLFSNAVEMSTVFRREEGVELLTMVASRMPFAVISIFIIHACYKIAKMFILEVIHISNRRLDLTKVSIVAKDVSDTSARNRDFSDNEIYELNTKLKMDLLKAHLKGYVADDYEYDIDINLWDRFKKRMTKKPMAKAASG